MESSTNSKYRQPGFETISFKFTELAAITTVTTTNPITISYETNNEALLNAPNNGYFELEAHPAKMMP